MLPTEQKRLQVIEQYINNKITRKEAANELELSERQISRLKTGIQNYGETYLIHKNRGRTPAHSISKDTKELIVKLKKEEPFCGFSILKFQRFLKEDYYIVISYSALHNLLFNAGLVTAKSQITQQHPFGGQRAKAFGELIHLTSRSLSIINNQRVVLHLAIDNATRRVIGAWADYEEYCSGYFKILQDVCTRYGLAECLHYKPLDPHLSESRDQIDRALLELGIANEKSLPYEILQGVQPAAEYFGTVVHQLIQKETSSLEEINQKLPMIIKYFNNTYSLKPRSRSAFLPCKETIHLDKYLCFKYSKKWNGSGTYYINGHHFQVKEKYGVPIPVKAPVTIIINIQKEVYLQYKQFLFQTVCSA